MKIKHLFSILFCLNLLSYIDRQVLYAVFPLLQQDLHLTDLQLGTLSSAFMLVYMCYAPVMGYLADRFPRPRLIGLSALIWSGATALCAGAWNYISLLIPRALVGVGEGGFTPIAQPFLAEHYPAQKHASVLAWFGLALPVGSALGYVLGGVLGQYMGWKRAFLAVGLPGVVLGVLACYVLKDMSRSSGAKAPGPKLREYLPLFKNRPFMCVCLAQAMSTFVVGGLSAWMPMYLHRYAGLDVARAGLYFGALVIVCGAAGTLIGGKWAAWWRGRSVNAYYGVIATSLAGALPFCWGCIGATTVGRMLGCLSISLVLLFLPTGAIAASLVATTRASVRSMAFAVNIFLIHLLGDALSPTLVGWVSGVWNLKMAVFVCTLMLVPGAWFGWKAIPKPYRHKV